MSQDSCEIDFGQHTGLILYIVLYGICWIYRSIIFVIYMYVCSWFFRHCFDSCSVVSFIEELATNWNWKLKYENWVPPTYYKYQMRETHLKRQTVKRSCWRHILAEVTKHRFWHLLPVIGMRFKGLQTLLQNVSLLMMMMMGTCSQCFVSKTTELFQIVCSDIKNANVTKFGGTKGELKRPPPLPPHVLHVFHILKRKNCTVRASLMCWTTLSTWIMKYAKYVNVN